MIYIIRHGQTEMNQAHALQGRSDQSLNENGIRQAQDAAKEFGGLCFDRVYSSPLGRAIQTAEIVAPGVPIVVDDRLIEMDYGPYEGADLTNMPSELIEFFRDFVHNPAPEGMEQLSSVVKRAGAFIEEIKELPENRNGHVGAPSEWKRN